MISWHSKDKSLNNLNDFESLEVLSKSDHVSVFLVKEKKTGDFLILKEVCVFSLWLSHD